MTPYEIIKDIIVPVSSPLIAALALITVVKQERYKIRAKQNFDLQRSVNAVEREVLLLREAYQLIGIQLKQGGTLESERIQTFEESSDRLFKVFHESPAVYDEYFAKNKSKLIKLRLPLLFSELQIKLRQVKTAKVIDPFILFALYLLLYARVSHGKDSEEIQILNNISATDPKFYSTWWA